MLLSLMVIAGTLALVTRRGDANHPPLAPATGRNATAQLTGSDEQLQQLIYTWAHANSFNASVLVSELNGAKRTAGYDQIKSMVTASTFKVYNAYAILHGIEQGSYTLDTVLGDGNSVQTDLNNMILNSDNAASRAIGFAYGWDAIDDLLKTQGLTATELNNYDPPSTAPEGDKYTTATDMAVFLTKLQAGRLLNPEHTKLLLSLMENQNYRNGIPAGVPAGVIVADKPGWLTAGDDDVSNSENDVAIVYGPKSTYVLIIYTDGTSMQPLADLSQQVYNYLET